MLSPVEQIKDRLSVVDVISSYLKLEKAGQNFKARCPFHNEKTPSFFVSPSRGSYHCFGCNRGGDIFTFVEEIEGVSFVEALKSLALRAGIKLGPIDGQLAKENNKSYDLLEAATKFFETNLLRNEKVKNYLKSRGLKEETVRNFRLGFALPGWSGLLDYLKAKGFSEKLMEENGLIIHGQKGYYDRFRSRIMFPLADSQGRIVGFTGRIFLAASLPSALESEASLKHQEAKYINSPETVLYNKSRILYGYDKAKREMLKENFCVIVEGQMDLLMAHQAGTVNTVAVSGTALTEEHLKLIKRLTDKILLTFDADQAGLKASERGWELALTLDMEVKIIKLPVGLDPADLILKDKKEWPKALLGAQDLISFLLDYYKNKAENQRELVHLVNQRIAPSMASIANPLIRAYSIKEIATQISLPEESVMARVKELIERKKNEKRGIKTEEKIQPEAKTIRKQIEEKILGIYFWLKDNPKSSLDFNKLETDYGKTVGHDLKEEAQKLDSSARNDLIFQAEMYYADEDILKKEIRELLINLEKEILEEKLSRLMPSLRQAEQNKKEKEIGIILKECQEISKRINEIKNSRFLEK